MQLLLFHWVVWRATDENFTYFLLSRFTTQYVIHSSSTQQTFKHVFNTKDILCPSGSMDCMGRIELKPYFKYLDELGSSYFTLGKDTASF